MFPGTRTRCTLQTAAIALAVLMATPAVLASDAIEMGRSELAVTQEWLDDRMQRTDNDVAEETDDAPKAENDPQPNNHDGNDDPPEGDGLQAWLEAQVADARNHQKEAERVLSVTLDDLGRQADDAVAQSQGMVALIELPSDSNGGEQMEPQSGAARDAPTMTRAIVVATVAAAATAGSLFVMFWTAGSTVGTAGTAGTAAKGSAGLKKVAPAFSPLFTRFEGREVLKHPNRIQLYTLIAANPGVRLQDLCQETELSRTAVTHHLRLLEQQHLIVSERMGRSRHYYENGGRYEREKKDAYAVLQNDRSKDIAQFILRNPGTIQKSLCESLDVRASIAHWHVKRLEEAALVEAVREGRTVSYYPAGALGQLSL